MPHRSGSSARSGSARLDRSFELGQGEFRVAQISTSQRRSCEEGTGGFRHSDTALVSEHGNVTMTSGARPARGPDLRPLTNRPCGVEPEPDLGRAPQRLAARVLSRRCVRPRTASSTSVSRSIPRDTCRGDSRRRRAVHAGRRRALQDAMFPPGAPRFRRASGPARSRGAPRPGS